MKKGHTAEYVPKHGGHNKKEFKPKRSRKKEDARIGRPPKPIFSSHSEGKVIFEPDILGLE
jgi:hypothetical protein